MLDRFWRRLTRGRKNRHERRRAAESKALALRVKAQKDEAERRQREAITNIKRLKPGEQYLLEVPGMRTVMVTVMRREHGQPVCFAPRWNRGENVILRILGWQSRTGERAIVHEQPRTHSKTDEYELVVGFERGGVSTLVLLAPGSLLVRPTWHQRSAGFA